MSSPRLSRSPSLVILFSVALFSPAGTSSAQNYGLGDQVLTIGAPAFRPILSTETWFFAFQGSNYIYGNDQTLFQAPVALPDGAEIFQMCLYADVPDAVSSVVAELDWMKLAPGGLSIGTGSVPDSLVSDEIPIGPGVVCTGPTFSYVIHDDADVDGDQVVEHVAHYVTGYIGSSGGLGGVRIAWRRQVSPPPGAPTFNDVPANDGAFQFIEALVASGITAGCGNGNYCPDAPLTRRQMAVFLARALGLHWPS